jgi:hypothetical protein
MSLMIGVLFCEWLYTSKGIQPTARAARKRLLSLMTLRSRSLRVRKLRLSLSLRRPGPSALITP